MNIINSHVGIFCSLIALNGVTVGNTCEDSIVANQENVLAEHVNGTSITYTRILL